MSRRLKTYRCRTTPQTAQSHFAVRGCCQAICSLEIIARSFCLYSGSFSRPSYHNGQLNIQLVMECHPFVLEARACGLERRSDGSKDPVVAYLPKRQISNPGT